MAFKGKKKTNEEKIKEIEELTIGMAEQIDSYFLSEKALREHLAFMANFHHYSVRNMALINKQFLGATAVGSFNFWKGKGAAVQKGKKGIKILVPTPVEFFLQNGQEVPVSSATKHEKELIAKDQLETGKKLFFKVGHVFEYTQTNAREMNLSVSGIFGSYHKDGVVENQKEILAALNKMAGKLDFTILDESPFELGTAKGAAFPYEKAIALNPRNTEYENIPTLIHELAHAKMHGPEKRAALTTNEKEFQAEMVSYVVANRYGIDTKDFSLSYLADWTKGREMKDKEQLLNEVRSTASEFIDEIDNHFDQVKERELQQEKSIDLPAALTEKALQVHEATTGQQLDAVEPMMYIHGISNEFKEFGETNNLDFDKFNQKQTAYTVAFPGNDQGMKMVSGQYEKGEYIHPLHQLDKEQVVDSSTVTKLETHYHNELLKQDDDFIQGFAFRMRTEIQKEDALAVQQKTERPKTINLELER